MRTEPSDLRAVITDVRADHRQRMTRCPAHDDHHASLSVGYGEARVLVTCHSGCALGDVLHAAGVPFRDLFDTAADASAPEPEAIYDYRDAGGTLVYQVCRFPEKQFRQRRPDGHGGWIWNLRGVVKVPYRLPELPGHDTLFIPEGEKDCDRLWHLGIAATTNSGGAGKWSKAETAALRTAGCQSVIIVPDHDDPGRAHADTVARACHAAGQGVRVLTLPDLPLHGDVSDWLQAGHTHDELLARARVCPVWVPGAATPPERPALDLVPLDGLLAEPDEAVEWLVADRFAFGTVNLLAGRPKAGKSTLARSLALAVARGDRWLGSRCHPGRVVYVALEDKRSEIRRHLRRMGATGHDPIRLFIGSAPRTLLADLAALVAAGDPIDLLIIDTAQRLLHVKDANDYALVTTAFEPILQLARTHGTCIVLLHHAGKADRAGIEQILGSTAWAASVDNVLLLNRTTRYRLVSSVQRIGPDLEDTVVQMDEAGEVRLAGSRYLVDRQVVADALLAVVADAGPEGITRPDLLAAVEARHEVKLQALALLGSDPRVHRTGAGTNRHPHRYTLVNPEPVARNSHPSETGSRVPSIEREPVSSSLVSPLPTPRQTGSRTRAGSHHADVPFVFDGLAFHDADGRPSKRGPS